MLEERARLEREPGPEGELYRLLADARIQAVPSAQHQRVRVTALEATATGSLARAVAALALAELQHGDEDRPSCQKKATEASCSRDCAVSATVRTLEASVQTETCPDRVKFGDIIAVNSCFDHVVLVSGPATLVPTFVTRHEDLPEEYEDAELAVVPIMEICSSEAGIVESYWVIEIPHLRLLSTITEGNVTDITDKPCLQIWQSPWQLDLVTVGEIIGELRMNQRNWCPWTAAQAYISSTCCHLEELPPMLRGGPICTSLIIKFYKMYEQRVGIDRAAPITSLQVALPRDLREAAVQCSFVLL